MRLGRVRRELRKSIKRIRELLVWSLREKDYELARYYSQIIAFIGKILHRKYPLCKCGILIIPGLTTTFRVRNAPEKHITRKCIICGYIRRFNLGQIKEKKKNLFAKV